MDFADAEPPGGCHSPCSKVGGLQAAMAAQTINAAKRIRGIRLVQQLHNRNVRMKPAAHTS